MFMTGHFTIRDRNVSELLQERGRSESLAGRAGLTHDDHPESSAVPISCDFSTVEKVIQYDHRIFDRNLPPA